MSQDPYLLGRLAVHYKLVTKDQLQEVLREQAKGEFEKSLGDLLVEHGLLAPQQLEKLLEVQRTMHEKQAAAHAATATSATGMFALPAAAVRPVASPKRPERAVDRLLDYTVRQAASDLRLGSGEKILLRLDGALVQMGERALGREQIDQFLAELLDAGQREQLAAQGQVDFSTSIPGVARFRGNAYRHQHGVALTLRAIPFEVPTLTELGLPTSLARLTSYHQGLVLITGPAGCGKSSTLAALLRIVNEERRDHIVTIEDPIEYIHEPLRCSVNQRQVGRDTASFARALKASLREDPDVIAIGELRDLETISLALTAAETGHLVLATLHTGSAVRTIDRIVGAYPPEQQPQIRTMFSESLRAVVSQRLVNRADGNGRVPAYEVLVGSRAVANLIREQKTFQLRSILQTGAAQGMSLLDASLAQLVRDKTITREEALRHAEDAKMIPAA
ncbi:MAG TPA: type IV pilus twitching motility protein PilT [Thermoanaerobaculia bacterium]|nr:type IV pilus twitching motility protein PilT [Thermoanaerobaculia bacterium]